jgi:PAS domain S-box-containing protein
MLVKEIMITAPVLVGPEASLQEVAARMISAEAAHVLVVDVQGQLLGLVSGYDLRKSMADGCCSCTVSDVMVPRERLFVVFPDTPVEEAAGIMTERRVSQLPVVEGNTPVGYLNMASVLEAKAVEARRNRDLLEQFRQAPALIAAMREGLVAVDSEFVIREFNPAAEKTSGLLARKMLGRKSLTYSAPDSAVRRVMESGEPLYNVEVQTNRGQVLLTNNVPVVQEGRIAGVVQTFTEITETKQLHLALLKARDELDKAFALTLPNTRVEQKLKNTPEYRDNFNQATGMIEITEVIDDGGYLHVVNALKVAADLNEKGMMGLLGIDKDTLVQALLFHDIGKSQPLLNVGQVVDPYKVFEESTRHAARSAEIAENYYGKPTDVAELIRYHHHREEELPDSFPRHLLPMLRLFRVIDGLSAGLTRRSARIGFRVSGSRLTVLEHNGHPAFNRTTEIDLYTGVELMFLEKKQRAARRGELRA